MAELTERSGQLERAGRAAKDEAAEVRRELDEAREALAEGRAEWEATAARLESLDREYRDAQAVQDNLR